MTGLLPLSLAQHEVLQDQRAWPGSPHLLLGGSGLLEGPVDLDLLWSSLQELVQEQPVLRLIPGVRGQRLLAALEPQLEELPVPADLAPEAALLEAWRAWTRTPPPLGEAASQPPWRMGLLRFSPQLNGLLLWAHHSLFDGLSTAQFMRRWAELYSARQAGQAASPADGEVFLRLLAADASYREGLGHEADAAFWAEELPAAPPPLWPAQAGREAELPRAHVCSQRLARDEYAAWAAYAHLEGQTEFAALAAALAWHYAALHQREEILIGVPVLNRHGRAQRQALGMFVGVMPLRLQLAGVETPRQLLALIGRQLRRAMRHARYPVSSLARQLKLAQSGREHLYDLVLSFERQDYSVRFGPARLTHSRQLFGGRARFPLGLTLCDFGADRELELTAEGSERVFDARALDLLLRRLRHLAAAMAAAPDAPLASLPLLPEAEREAVVEGLHQDLASLAEPQSFVERFAAQAALHPQAPALVGEALSWRYGELAARAEGLATALGRLQAGDTVALALPRGPWLVAAMLAVARAGGAFVPLDLEAPDARLQGLLQQLQPRAWLGLAADAQRLSGLHPGWLAADAAPPQALPLPDFPLPSAPAYALFTSGSTGRPKAVLVSHGALARRFAWLSKAWDLGPADRSLQGTQPTFDPSLIELLLPLTLGGSVALTPAGRMAPERWAGFALRHGCSFSALVPTTLARLLDGVEALAPEQRQGLRLRVACCGGEVLSPQLAARWRRLTGAQLWNVYGPTEACIFATAWACREADESDAQPLPLPIGSPVDDARVYVLDAQLQALPVGTPGEICIGGPALAEGYLHDAARTAAAFVPDPFVPGGRLYRSGDRGYLDGEGRLQFLGRADRQLKIRGQRVEPGEVETLLLALPGVQEAAVMGWGQPLRLHAWIAPAHLDLAQLQQLARERFPEPLLPAGWSLLAALPRSATGKLEVARLPAPEVSQTVASREPANALERQLLSLLRQTLKRPELGVDDDFFAAGGDSLAALDWLGAIEQATGLSVELALLAQAPSVAGLAARLSARALAAPASAVALPLGEPGPGPVLYLAASGHGDLLRFQALAEVLAPACRLQMLQPPAGVGPQELQALARAYGQHILAQGERDIHLAGFSVGGVTALETARWLQAVGHAPASLVLVDTVFPRWLFRQPWLWKLMAWLTRSLYVQELSMNGRRLGAMFKDAGLVGQVLALRDYRAEPYAGEVLLLRSSGLRRWQDWLFGPWRRLLLKLREREVQGLHGSIFEAGRVGGLAQCLHQALGLAPSLPE